MILLILYFCLWNKIASTKRLMSASDPGCPIIWWFWWGKGEGGDGFVSVWLERHLVIRLSMQVLYFLHVFKKRDKWCSKESFQIAFCRRRFQPGDSEQGCSACCPARMVTSVLYVLALLHPVETCLTPTKPSIGIPCLQPTQGPPLKDLR